MSPSPEGNEATGDAGNKDAHDESSGGYGGYGGCGDDNVGGGPVPFSLAQVLKDLVLDTHSDIQTVVVRQPRISVLGQGGGRVEDASKSYLLRVDLRRVFDSVDVDHDGRVTRSELIHALRHDSELAATLHLPQHVREGATRDAFVHAFNRIAAHHHDWIDWPEFASALTNAGVSGDAVALVLTSPGVNVMATPIPSALDVCVALVLCLYRFPTSKIENVIACALKHRCSPPPLAWPHRLHVRMAVLALDRYH